MLNPEKKKEMMEGIVKEIMQRMKDQGMSDDAALEIFFPIRKKSVKAVV